MAYLRNLLNVFPTLGVFVVYTLQPHKGHLTSKLNSMRVLVLPSLDPSLIFHFHLLPSLVHLTGFSFRFFSCFLAIFILSSNNISFAYILLYHTTKRKHSIRGIIYLFNY